MKQETEGMGECCSKRCMAAARKASRPMLPVFVSYPSRPRQVTRLTRRDDLGDLMLKANFHVRQELVLAQGALVRPSFALRGAERFAGVGELGFHHIDTEGERGRAA
jgi:hypothetical protein